MAYETLAMSTGHLAAFAAVTVLMIVGTVITYLYTSFTLMLVAQNLGHEDTYLAWIPFVNVYLMTEMAEVKWWYTLIILGFTLIPLVGIKIALAIGVYLWWKIALRLGKPGWWSLLLVVPVVNVFVLGLMARIRK